MILGSAAYSLGKDAVVQQLALPQNDAGHLVELAWWRPWVYGESASSGHAAFTMCGTANSGIAKCFETNVAKKDGEWQVLSIKER